MKIYCEQGALTKEIKELGRRRNIELVHFPYDLGSHTRKIHGVATPSKAQFQDLNLSIAELPGAMTDYKGSPHLEEILLVIGSSNRRDALHVDSAFKQGCVAFITPDKEHILEHKTELESMLGVRFFHFSEWSNLEQFVAGSGAANALPE